MPRIDCFKHIKGNKELEKHFSSIGEDLPESEQRDKAIELANEYYKIIHADMNVLNTLLKKPRVIFKPKNNLAQIKKVKEDADAKIKALTNQAEGADVQKASDTPRQDDGKYKVEQTKNIKNETGKEIQSPTGGQINDVLESAGNKAESDNEVELNEAIQEADQVILATGIKTATLPISDLIVAPKVFQYKASINESGTNANEQIKDSFDPNDAGTIGVWRDVNNELGNGKNKVYVVDGHHRTERARLDNVESMNVFFINAPTAKDAMIIAARTNIKQGKGTSIDAAKVIRENPNAMKGLIAPNSKVAKEGQALSKLNDKLFEEVSTGNLSMKAAIGLSNVSIENQDKVRNTVVKYANNPTANQDRLNRYAVLAERQLEKGNADVVSQVNLFGEDFELDTQAMAEVQSEIVSNLKDDARLLNSASRNADILENANSKIDTEATANEGQKSKLASALFDKQINEKGTREIFDKAVSDYKKAKNKSEKDAIIKRATQKIKDEIVKQEVKFMASLNPAIDKASKEYQSAKRAYDNKRKELYGSAMNDSADLFGNVKSQENSLFGDQTEKADEAKIAKALEPYKVRLDNAKKALEKANKDAQSQGTLFNAKKGNNTSSKSLGSTLKKLITRLQKAIKANVFSNQELLKQKLKEYGMDYTKFMANFGGIKQVEIPKGMKVVDDGEGNFALLDKNGINISGWGSFSDIEESAKDEFPIGTKEIKDATSLDILSNVNKFTLKQLISILQYNDRNGEWQSEFDKLEKYGSRVDERKLLKDARVAVKDLAEGMLKDDGFDDYFMDIKSDYKGEETPKILFMRTPKGVIYGAKFPDGSIYINNEDIDLSSPIHEFSHLFEEMYPELWAEGLRLFRDSSGFKKALKEVQDNPAYSNLTEAKQASEALNNLIGNKGVGYFAKGVLLSKFQNWVNKLFKTIGNRIGKKYVDKIGQKLGNKVAQKLTLTPDDSLEFFVNDVLGKLLSGKELQSETQSTATTKFSQEYENSTQFEKWKGNNRLVSGDEVQNVKTGEPIVVKGYHGTTNEFYEFDSSVKGNIEGHLGKVNYFTTSEDDASQNYLSQGADITSRVENLKERVLSDLENEVDESLEENEKEDKIREVISEKYPDFDSSSLDYNMDLFEVADRVSSSLLLGGEEQVLDLYIKLNNPIVLGNGSTWFDALEVDETYLEDATKEIADENGISEEEAKDDYYWDIRERAIEMQGESNKVVDALEKALSDNGYDSSLASEILGDNYYESEVDLDKIEKSLRKAELYDNENGELASSQVIADLFYNLGFDGIILTDVSERFRNMGLNESTSHIHVFDKYNNQIKLADGTNTTFNPDTNDIRFQVRQNPTQATKSEIENAISSLDVAVLDYANDDSIDNYLSLNDAFETLAYTSIGDAQSMAKDLIAKYPELKDDFDSIINEASKPKVESKKVTNESDAIRTLISEEVDGRLYPTIVDSLGKFVKKQDTAETTSKVQEREVSGEYVRLTLQNMKDIATQKALQLQDVLGEDWVKKSIEFFEREPFSGNPAIIIGLSNIISSDLDAQIKATTDIKELDALVALQNRMDRVVNRNGRVASLALNYRRIFTSFAQGDSVTDSMAGNNLTEESKKQIEVVKKALAEQPTDEQLNSQGNVVTPTTPKAKTTKSSRKTQTDSVLKSQIKNNAINSLTQVDANGKKVTKTWQDAVREANEEIKKHKC